MSRVDSLHAGRQSRPSGPPKRAEFESTSFDLALAQALSGKDAAARPPQPRPPEPESRPDGGEQEPTIPKSAAGPEGSAETTGMRKARPGSEQDRSTPEGSGESAADDSPAERSPAAPSAAPKPEQAAAAVPAIDAARIETVAAKTSTSSGAARPASAPEGSGASGGVGGTTGTDAPRSGEAAEATTPSPRGAEAQDPAEAGAASTAASSHRVTLRFSEEGGSSGRIRLAVRGRALHATIVSSDMDAVRRWNDDLGSLHRSLLDQGFSETKITVRPTESHDPARPSRGYPENRTADDRDRDSSTPTHDRGRRNDRLAS
jgi:hypothetical protein